ncbi:hypothetical protein AB0H07_39155 [Streptomyces sp. NPDC021354]|uniref:hypothetical protein n=1 Tax=Streptomyces sp. NPDC021354 TaxID=3154793 RepID=UPI0033D76A21
MTPRRRRAAGGGRRGQRNEAARLTEQLMEAGEFSKKQVGAILGRDPSLVSQFFTKNKGASLVPALRAALQAVQAGVRDTESLQAIAAGHIQPRLSKTGARARVRGRSSARAEKTVTEDGRRVKRWTSSMAKAGRQHIAAGASRLYPVVAEAAANRGRIAFTVRARRDAFIHDSGRLADSPGVRRNVVQRRDRTEERAYGNNVGGPGSGEEGFDAVEFKAMVDAAGGDVAAAVLNWLVDTGRIAPGTQLTSLEIRAWRLRED